MAKKRSKKSSGLNLSAPKQVTWVIAVIAGVLGLLGAFAGVSIGVAPAVLLAIGFVVLAVASVANGL